MPELGRRCIAVLLDDQKVETVVQPTLQGCDLLDLVASHFSLKEKEYFGLCLDGTEMMPQWLELDRPVLDQDIPQGGPLRLRLQVRYYVESLSWLQDAIAVELFYYQCKQNVFKDLIQCDSHTVFELAAYVLQATYGDFSNAVTAKEDLKRLPVIPASTLKEHPDTNYCESEILRVYQYLTGRSRGVAIISYLNTVLSQPTYGLHCYDVKDRVDAPFLLGLSPKGLAVYEQGQRAHPKQLYEWKNLENIYHRDKKFSIEVYNSSEAQTGSMVRSGTSRNMSVLVWFSNNPRLLRSLFNTAKGQHQLYLSKRAARSMSPSCRSPSDLAHELSVSTVSLSSSTLTGSTNSLMSAGSRGNTISEETAQAAQEAARLAEREMYFALLSRRDTLKQQLRKREEELTTLYNEEAKVTSRRHKAAPGYNSGKLKKIGASFEYSPSIINPDPHRRNTIEDLQKEVEIQQKIVDAAHRLSGEKGLSRNVRKERKESYERATNKLRLLKQRLEAMNHQTDLSRSFESGLDDQKRPLSPAVSTHSAPSTMSPSPTGSPVLPRASRGEKFKSQADEDYVASLIEGGRHRASTPKTGLSPMSTTTSLHSHTRMQATSRTPPARPSSASSLHQAVPQPVTMRTRMTPTNATPSAANSTVNAQGESIIPIVRQRMQSLARNRDSFLLNDPSPQPNGVSSHPDSTSSEDESHSTDVSWLDEQQLFGQGTLV